MLREFRVARGDFEGGDLKVSGWRVRATGGPWLAETRGKAFDNMLCKPKDGSPEMHWAVANGLGKHWSFATERYGVAAAHLLASVYGHKAQWFTTNGPLGGRRGQLLMSLTRSRRTLQP